MAMRNPQPKPKSRILVFPQDLRPTMYEAIGEYLARAARFEFNLISAIGLLAGINDNKKRRISFMGMTFNARLGTFKALASYWAPNKRIRDQIYNIVSAGRKLRVTRNSLAHGAWGYEKGAAKRQLYVYFAPESKDYYLPKSKHYTADELLAKAMSIRRLDIRLEKIMGRLAAAAKGA